MQRGRNGAEPLPIDLGPEGDAVYLILYGSNLGQQGIGTATVGGVNTTLAYAAPTPPFNGVAQHNVLVPRSLAGAGRVDVTVTVNNRSSNTVSVTLR